MPDVIAAFLPATLSPPSRPMRPSPIAAGLLISALASLLLAPLCQPASATTLVRCRINDKTIYSDTDCPNDANSNRRSGFHGMPTSKPITIRTRRNKAGATSASRKSAAH